MKRSNMLRIHTLCCGGFKICSGGYQGDAKLSKVMQNLRPVMQNLVMQNWSTRLVEQQIHAHKLRAFGTSSFNNEHTSGRLCHFVSLGLRTDEADLELMWRCHHCRQWAAYIPVCTTKKLHSLLRTTRTLLTLLAMPEKYDR
jgi:hypothetical protein